ncbi:type III-B CRISPR module RAMP protein Cmr1 [Thermoanaerobacterium thermosaccharolyticum]|uniref:type III-B CRISPR module RAMP protein Cmr1 n=1 Tax=Thermoanaerobacterium thermosaccharolyticum TaxID=1517 RepID=UPI003D2B59D0
MCELRILCKVITPMVMTGSNGKDVELRPSEFKGMMRFWWRATKAENDLNELKKKEVELFGKIERKSNFGIRVVPCEVMKIEEANILPHKKNGYKKNAISSNYIFEVILSCPDDKQLQLCKNIFILSTILGGYGRRSRRGFGSVRAVSINDIPLEQTIDLSYIASLLNNSIGSNVYTITRNKIVSGKRGGNYPWIKEIVLGKKTKDINKLLKKISQAAHDFYNYRDLSLGNIKPRMSSPIYVSIIKEYDNYIPIVTTLNSYYSKDKNYKWDFNKQNSFIQRVIS